ncbi:MAG: Cation-independent mannose-6-phosphate receptor CI-MPR [Vezdaea aestivalis]|nr:MAG: Cation-independent mannose-6-phosphate receptor CI-MPR [Vezdaea aestivalis]
MQPHLGTLGLALFSLLSLAFADDKKTKIKAGPACTVHSSNSGSFFDLRPLSLLPPKDDAKPAKEQRIESWHAKGYDYPYNFTINFCAPVIEDLKKVQGIDSAHVKNVSAYYEDHGKIYSIGQQSASPIFRGRKLVLNYTNGSPCESSSASRLLNREIIPSKQDKTKPKKGDDEEDDGGHSKGRPKEAKRKKSTIISLLCDKDISTPKVAISFVGASPDECAYFFEARSASACGGVSKETATLSPGGVFGVICLIALLVYMIGGCMYQRTVMHARGWRQLPNYSMWAGVGGFLRDLIVILTSSCGRVLNQRSGYRNLSTSANGYGRRGNRSDDENRLIDQLDEEWED